MRRFKDIIMYGWVVLFSCKEEKTEQSIKLQFRFEIKILSSCFLNNNYVGRSDAGLSLQNILFYLL